MDFRFLEFIHVDLTLGTCSIFDNQIHIEHLLNKIYCVTDTIGNIDYLLILMKITLKYNSK